MSTLLNPYLHFHGDAAEALGFYRSVLGGELTTSTYADLGAGTPEEAGKVMHGQLTTEAGHTIMGADAPGAAAAERGLQQVSLSGDDDALLRSWWEGLSEGASIVEPLVVAPWGDAFGMLDDRFGVRWLVNIAAARD